MKYILPILILTLLGCVTANVASAQKITFLFDLSHGQNPRIAQGWKEILLDTARQEIVAYDGDLNTDAMSGRDVLVLFSPTAPLQPAETAAIRAWLKTGGSLLLLFDEERRTPLNVGVNELITPFGMELTENTPVRHNCGAVAEKSAVCSDRRELPYSGGRSIKGGNVISRVYDDGGYIHAAYLNLDGGGKLVVMSDAMAGLLLGQPDGIRFSGTGPNDSKYWGKDSEIFMKEILAFLGK